MDVFDIPQLDESVGRAKGADRSYRYALIGFMLGIAAPVGWLLLRAWFFPRPDEQFLTGVLADIFISRENSYHYLYMGAGTSIVLGIFGYFIGRAAQQIHQRAERLDEMHRKVAAQKESFAQRYIDLNARIQRFHSITARLQRSMDVEELYRLSVNALHEVLEFERANLFLVDHEAGQLRLIASRGCGSPEIGGISLPLDERAGVLFKAVNDQRSFLVDDMALMPADFHFCAPCDSISQLDSESFLICPVLVGKRVLALIYVDHKSTGRSLEAADQDTLELLAGQLSASITRVGLINAVEELTDELGLTFRELAGYRNRYQDMLDSLKQSSSSTRELVAGIAGSADVVRDALNNTQSASGEISVSIEQVGQNLTQLSAFMEKSISAMSEIAAAIRSVEEHSVSSHQMSEQARERAEHGAQSVREALVGLKGISSGVDVAASAMGQLSERGAEVSSISSVISEIAQKTNLLALNAAIIAAQAGEQGRSFAVVADEIRELSQQTAGSSAAISGLIRDMQSGMLEVVSHIDNTQKLVDNGFDKGRGADVALSQILETAGQSMEMALKIRQSTREVSTSAEFVTRSIEELGEMTEQVSTATREQVQGTRSIVRSIEEVSHMSEDMAKATLQQRKDSETIEMAVDSVSKMAKQIFTSMDNRQKQSQNVIGRLQQLKETDNAL